jgi:hypothetical protein
LRALGEAASKKNFGDLRNKSTLSAENIYEAAALERINPTNRAGEMPRKTK